MTIFKEHKFLSINLIMKLMLLLWCNQLSCKLDLMDKSCKIIKACNKLMLNLNWINRMLSNIINNRLCTKTNKCHNLLNKLIINNKMRIKSLRLITQNNISKTLLINNKLLDLLLTNFLNEIYFLFNHGLKI